MNKPEALRTFYENKDSSLLISNFIKTINVGDCVILCIGTDKCIGDSLGPLVGTLLEKACIEYPIYGTLESPVHAKNLKDVTFRIKTEYPNRSIIAIDASLGHEECIGTIQVKKGAIKPGDGAGKDLEAVGNVSITGVIKDIFHTRLNLIMKMAEVIAEAVYMALK